jgi:serine/threonine protein kinase
MGTFVGTPLYASPEMLNDNESSEGTDLWALGCILYQMLYGRVPFQGRTDLETFELITNRELKFPEIIAVSEEAIDLMAKFLSLVPNLRGQKDYERLKAHPFFNGLDFNSLTADIP